MTVLWLISGSMESMQYIQDLEDARPPGFEFTNRSQVHAYKMRMVSEYSAHGDAERGPLWFAGMPTPHFRIGDPGFALDYFDVGTACVSARLRAALAPANEAVRYRDVNLDGSPPAVRGHGYQAMLVVPFADPFDHDRTSGEMAEMPLADGSVRREWRLSMPAPGRPPLQIHWKEGFVPPAPLFRVPGLSWTLATEALAASVMKAGISDLVFQDVTKESSPSNIFLRK